VCHSGAALGAEPGTHVHASGCGWLPGSRFASPGMTRECYPGEEVTQAGFIGRKASAAGIGRIAS